MFFAALRSRSCRTRQDGHRHARADKLRSASTNPQAEHTRTWHEAGCTHLSVNTMGAGLRSVDDHLLALESAAEITKPFGE